MYPLAPIRQSELAYKPEDVIIFEPKKRWATCRAWAKEGRTRAFPTPRLSKCLEMAVQGPGRGSASQLA